MRKVIPTFTLCLAVLLSACSTSSAPTATPTPSPTPAPTATAVPSATPEPTVVHRPSSAVSSGWWNETVFYEIFVRSFYDSNGDGKGDFKGITARLDYLQQLGVRGLWLMPIHPSPSYHGYDVTDYRATNPDYGTLDDFKQLLTEAHQRGIKIIMDFVLNHTSVEHPWFVASQDPKSDKRDWYIWNDKAETYLGPWGEQVWYPGKVGYYYAVFWEGMPDLNYRNPAVTKEMEGVASFWLKDVGVDGLRLDGARHLIEQGTIQANTKATHDWYKQFYPFTKSVKPDAMTIGEVWDSALAAVPYVQDQEMDLVFDFDLASTYVSAASSGSATNLYSAFKYNVNYFPLNQFGSFLTNHDMDRVMSQLGGDVNKMKTAAVLYLTGPGVPFIYYGEEIGMTGSKPDEKIRTPMQWSDDANAGFTAGTPWEPINTDYKENNVAEQLIDPNALLPLYRKVIGLRNQHAARSAGTYAPLAAGNSAVFAALRTGAGESILIVLNLGSTAVKDYSLSLDESTLQGAYTPQILLGDGAPAPFSVNDRGGITSYQPLPELPPGARLIMLLKPSK